ncbi:Phage Tail Collar Domain protein [compost metagenome]
MSTEPFIGEVKLLGFNFPPLGYMTCQGQILSIAAYTALFSLIGTTYGGNGQTTFALPDLQGRMPVGQGQGPGLPDYTMGQASGNTNMSLKTDNLPQHIHTLVNMHVQVKASSATAGEQSPDGTFPATTGSPAYADTATNNIFTGGTQVSGTTDAAGSGMPFNILNPFLCLNFSIAVEGIFPSRN